MSYFVLPIMFYTVLNVSFSALINPIVEEETSAFLQ